MKRQILFFFCFMMRLLAMGQTGHFFSSDRFSSSLISDLCQDVNGSLWIATDYGLNRFDGYHFSSYLHDDTDSTSLAVNVVVSLLCDREGRLWVGTNHGLDRYDAGLDAFIHYPFPNGIHPRVSSLLQRSDGTLLVGTAGYGAFALNEKGKLVGFSLENADNYFSRFYEDKQKRLWRGGFNDMLSFWEGDKVHSFHCSEGSPLGFAEHGDELLVLCQHGIMSYRDGKMSVANIDLGELAGKDVVFSKIVAADDSTIYIGTRGRGVYRLRMVSGRSRLEPFEMSALGIDTRTTKISAMLVDRWGNLWMGCHHKGLLQASHRPAQFGNWSFQLQGIMLGSTISSVCEGDNGMVWCTVQGTGVYGFDRRGRVSAHPASPDAVEFIFRDNRKRYWLGTDDGLFAYDPLTGRSELRVTFDCDMFNDMTCDAEGCIYISTFSRGFCIYNPQTGKLRNYHMDAEADSLRGSLCNNWVMGMTADRKGFVWLATSSGVSCYDPKTDGFRSQGWDRILDRIVCFDVCELYGGQLSDGRSLAGCIAIGTEQGLYLYDRSTRKVERFPDSEQLQNKAISYIVQANDGDVWCSTSMGIWQYQLSTHSFVGHINGNGLMQKEYLYGVGMHSDNDVIYFGHNDGLTVFSPQNVSQAHPSLDPPQLVAFLVGGQKVSMRTVLNGVKVTDSPVGESGYFTLSYLDHTVTLAFSQINFENPMNVAYEYQVNNGGWVRNLTGQNDFTLSHLQPGTYRIEVRALQAGAYTPSKVLVITVRSPWYRSLTAYFLYFLVLVSIGIYALYTYRRRANQQLNEEKMKFLINATHDIRSPLTLIMSPLEKLKNLKIEALSTPEEISNLKSQISNPLDTIERNTQRILNLVNQILDVRKIDKQQMRLYCQPTDMVSFVSAIFKMYEFSAHERGIQYAFVPDAEKIEAWVDRSQFDKVVSNLLSNAFKYCSEGGNVELRLSHDEQHVSLQVIDTGVGLDSDNLRHIFDRFYQGSNSRRMHINGTGIGLNLCKMIVDMHHGTIEAANRTDGQRGAVFTVTLPLGRDHLSDDEIETMPVEMPATTVAQKVPGGKRRVLLVDDDEEIGRYISAELGHYYKFTICQNGKEGLKELLTSEYDAVVSDVMMPEMDGFTMLRMIKTNVNVNDVPVVMLTSKADVGNRLEGLERGADAFLAKPFNMDELHMVIDNLIQGRQRLKGKYSGAQQQADRVEQPEVKGNDELLMERIMKAVNKNLGDSDFNVDMLTQEVGISRAQLHRKMKELTGISTSEFIRNIRLEQAARLLKEQKINITQVAYTVGFSNLAHFSTIFRKHFGVSPSEYVEREGESAAQ